MPTRLALLHTSHVLVPEFTRLCAEHLPHTRVFHIVAEHLIQDTIAAGAVTAATAGRMTSYARAARLAGADAVLVTCSSLGPGIPEVRAQCDFPVLRVDEAMAEEAVRIGGRIGVLATLATTLAPTCDLLRATAAARSTRIELLPQLCPGAFEAVLAGDNQKHNALLRESLLELLPQSDAIVLAQASMARIVQELPPVPNMRPILSSPRLAVLQARRLLHGEAPPLSATPGG